MKAMAHIKAYKKRYGVAVVLFLLTTVAAYLGIDEAEQAALLSQAADLMNNLTEAMSNDEFE